MNKVLAVLTDLDGTIIFPDGTISDATKSSIKNLVQRDIIVAPVTGRSLRSANEICRDLGISGMGVFSGGAVVADISTQDVLWEQPLSGDLATDLLYGLAPLCHFLSFGQGRMYAKDLNKNVNVSRCLSIWAEANHEKLAEIEKIIKQYPDIVCHTNSSFVKGLIGLQINHCNANKQFGAKKLLEFINIEQAYALAIGDDNNDLPFFEAAGLKVAMGNAPKKLVDKADFITKSINENGFTEAMNKYVLGIA